MESKVKLISFPQGLFGFEHLRFFYLQSLEEGSVYTLNAHENEEIKFFVCDPFLICPAYRPIFLQKDLNLLHLEEFKDGVILTILAMHAETITANLMAPILINPQNRMALQGVLFNYEEYSTRYLVKKLNTKPIALHAYSFS